MTAIKGLAPGKQSPPANRRPIVFEAVTFLFCFVFEWVFSRAFRRFDFGFRFGISPGSLCACAGPESGKCPNNNVYRSDAYVGDLGLFERLNILNRMFIVIVCIIRVVGWVFMIFNFASNEIVLIGLRIFA